MGRIFANRQELKEAASVLRGVLAPAFSAETALPEARLPTSRAAGQCAAVAAIVREIVGGLLVSARVAGVSHWFNRLPVGSSFMDLDITGDQFGLAAIRAADAGQLFAGSRIRERHELNRETIARAAMLAARAGLDVSRNAARAPGADLYWPQRLGISITHFG